MFSYIFAINWFITTGPVLELRRRLAEELVVIDCDEHRTSQLCLDCGRKVKTPIRHQTRKQIYGISYCSDRKLYRTISEKHHRRIEDRDIPAAFKIGARYLAQKRHHDLGPWKRGAIVEDQPTRAYTVLRDVLTAYQDESSRGANSLPR